jgi:hypothetical protein
MESRIIMSETSKMHFVPRTYLKHFAKKKRRDYIINVLPKRSLDKFSIYPRNTKDVCYETDIYKLNGSTEDERQFIETMYRFVYEEGYDDLYKVLTDESRKFLTAEERYATIAFMVSMFYRNVTWGNTYNTFMDRLYNGAYQLAKENDKDSFIMTDGDGNEEEISFEGKSLEQFQKDMKEKDRAMVALTMAEKTFQLTRARLINDVVCVTKLSDGYEYVTSDNPVIVRNNETKQPIPFDPTNILSMPIDNKHLVQLRSMGNEVNPLMLCLAKEEPLISKASSMINNHSQASQADKLILGSETGLRQLLWSLKKDNSL